MSDPTPNPEENSPIANFAALDSPPQDISRSDSMQEFYQLRQELLLTSVVLMLVVFPAVWFFYSFNTALNYIVGAITALIYLRLLANNVEQLGRGKTKVGKSQLLVLVVVLVIATRWQQLHILPVFLGFLTYKAAILVYMFRTVILPPQTGQ